MYWELSWWLSNKESAYKAGATGAVGAIVESGRSLGGVHGYPLQYSCLENPIDRGAWQATVHRSQRVHTGLKQLSMHTCMYVFIYIYYLTVCWEGLGKWGPNSSKQSSYLASKCVFTKTECEIHWKMTDSRARAEKLQNGPGTPCVRKQGSAQRIKRHVKRMKKQTWIGFQWLN